MSGAIRAIQIEHDHGGKLGRGFAVTTEEVPANHPVIAVTRIEKTTRPGMYGDIPYIVVWKGDECLAEFCQHNIVGVYYLVAGEGAEAGEAA